MNALQAPAYLVLAFVLCWLGKLAYGLLHPRTKLGREITARENVAFAVPLGAYYFGILLVMGGPFSGTAHGAFISDLVKTGAWGLLSIAMLNVAWFADRRVLFRGIELHREILDRKNLAAGVAVAGSYLANALIILGALTGEGPLLATVVLWLYAQLLLSLAIVATDRWMDVDLAAEIGRGNVAACLAYTGTLVAMGNVLRMSLAGSFTGWGPAFASVTGYGVGGVLLLFIARELTHRLLLSGVTIRHELLEEKVPNAGVGYLVALLSLGASILIGWCI